MGGVLREGEPLGPFLLERKIAIGGMAEVWSAVRPEDRERRRFALKIMLDAFLADPVLRAMFDDEVKIAKRLRHPNIVKVEGEAEDRGILFLAMELIDGKDLRRILAAAAKAKAIMPIPLAVLIARESARGLGYAHTAKGHDGQPLEIVHRDVSPHNIMIDRQGGVRVLDFGVARARERLTRTLAGVIKGKIAYMAPEQMLAQPITAQADIFALGIVLWEMLAMKRLFASPVDAEVFSAVCSARVPPIAEHRPDLPPILGELVHAMLALHPKDRPESMRAVENTLSRVLSTSFSEAEGTARALAGWAAGYLETPKRRTALMNPPLDATIAGPIVAPSGSEQPTTAIAFEEVESDAAFLPTEAIQIAGELAEFMAEPPGDLQDTLRPEPLPSDPIEIGAAAADLAATVSEPYHEPLLQVVPRDLSEPGEQLAPTMPIKMMPLPEARLSPTRVDALAARISTEPGPLAPREVSTPLQALRAEPREAASDPALAPPLSPVALPSRREAAPAPPPSTSRAWWVISGLFVTTGALLLLGRACGL